jgi:protein ImuB
LLERLSARLGSQHVQGVELQADHCPERAQRWQAASGALQSQPSPRSKNATKSGAVHAIQSGVKPLFDTSFLAHADLYPTWLLNTPQRLVVLQGVPQYQGRLDLLAGPQRLESGWLEGEETAALRDYFVARSRSAGLVWVYRERLSGRMGAGKSHWYLHGLFA